MNPNMQYQQTAQNPQYAQRPVNQGQQNPAAKPIFCGECGTKNAPGTKFCGGCGAKLS